MTLETTWFCLLWWMLATYVVLDGFDLGVGVLHLFVARTEAERTQVVGSVGPVWDGNEVWLLAAGGTMVMTFPALYAASFSGFYLPLMLVLWLLVARALGIELRHQMHDPLWMQFWDVAFTWSSVLLIVCFGAALGNIVRGVPFTAERGFFEPLWTDFRVGAQTGILDWYTVLIGVTALAVLTHHGALWLAHRTDGPVEARSRRWALRLWPAAAVLAAAATVLSFVVQPNLRDAVATRPGIIAFPAIAAVTLAACLAWQLRGRWDRAFTASSVFLYGMMGCAAAGIWPDALPARDPALSLTIREAAAPESGLVVALYWWIPGMLIVCAYTGLFTYRMLPARFHLEDSPPEAT